MAWIVLGVIVLVCSVLIIADNVRWGLAARRSAVVRLADLPTPRPRRSADLRTRLAAAAVSALPSGDAGLAGGTLQDPREQPLAAPPPRDRVIGQDQVRGERYLRLLASQDAFRRRANDRAAR